MSDKESRSILTGLPCSLESNIDNFNSCYNDPAIGKYAIKYEVQSEIKESDRRKLASILAQRKLRTRPDSDSIMIVKESPQDNKYWKEVTLDELLSSYPLSVVEILDEVLINLSKLIDHPSRKIAITDDKIWILYSNDMESRDYILRQLSELSFIEVTESMTDPPHPNVTIESGGWARLQELQKRPSGGRNQAFVAMWFNEEMNEYYEMAIKPAIEQNGTKCIRIDLHEHNNKICDEIIKEINKSKYVVADFTGNRGGVYYEAGFAHGLGIPVIWTIQRKELKDVHFDTRQYNHIVYESVEELRDKLTNRIQATIK